MGGGSTVRMESFPRGSDPARRPDRGHGTTTGVENIAEMAASGVVPPSPMATSGAAPERAPSASGTSDASVSTAGPASNGRPSIPQEGSDRAASTPPDTPATTRQQWFGGDLRRSDALVAGVLAAIAMVVAFRFRSALVPTDPWHYVQGAIAFPDGTWRPEGLSRWGYLLPMIPFARLWGDSTATYYVLPLLSTGLLAAVLYLLGTRHVNRIAGVASASTVPRTPAIRFTCLVPSR